MNLYKTSSDEELFFSEIIPKLLHDLTLSRMDIKMKKGNICHALRKRSLMSTNVFLFDVGKSKTFDEINYAVLEKIKNGRIVADKYNTAELKFYTPNIVVVFSNGWPDTRQLSKDRWKIFQIRDHELMDVTDVNV